MRRKNHKYRLKIAIVVAIVIAAGAAGWFVFGKNTASVPTKVKSVLSNSQPAAADNGTIRFVATGDMLPHETVNQAAKTANGYDYTPLFMHVQSYLKDADITYCNQESPSAKGLSVTGYPTFNAPVAFSKDLSATGCNLINLANNHAFDRGQAGIDGTLDVWGQLPTLAKAGINRTAAEQNHIAYFEKKGLRFAFLSYTECSNNTTAPASSLNILGKPLVDSQIAEAKTKADMIIVGTHWCKENVSLQSSSQDTWAQYFADKGVNIVIGTGPHFLQPVKKLERAGGGSTIVWFSLGNFLSTQEQVNGLIGGIATMDISVAKKDVTSISFLPTYMHYEWTATEKAQGDLLKRKNLMIYPLSQAAKPLAQSQNGTTAEAQTKRVTELMNTYTSVKINTTN